MGTRQAKFYDLVSAFPETVRPVLELLIPQAGRLTPSQCREIMAQLGISEEGLMVRLLPLAAHYARVPVSGFRVGAVVKASDSADDGFGLFLGANLEFAGQSLNNAVHAEQAAVSNAWHCDAAEISVLAVSAAPCGYCRQFLNELEHGDRIEVIIASRNGEISVQSPLSALLPHAFGPRDLNQSQGFMAPEGRPHPLLLKSPVEDGLVNGALAATATAYAPYTQNWAGCGIEIEDGSLFFGRYVETAAFNPSISPLQAALINLNMAQTTGEPLLHRTVLVEHPTTTSQRRSTATLLQSIAPTVDLEYFKAQPQ